MPTPAEWYKRAQETLRREREVRLPNPLDSLTLEELPTMHVEVIE